MSLKPDLTTTVAGHELLLLPERAAFLPAFSLLLVADAHIGKALSFRRLGVPVPAGTTLENLARLSRALAATGARRVVFLGDLLHSARAHAPALWAAVQAWRTAHADVELTLVRGNHDAHAGDPPDAWRVDCIDGPLLLPAGRPDGHPASAGPALTLALSHHPDPVAGAYVLAGHVHPVVAIGGRAHQRLRLPCFHFGAAVGVLPAFGAFTGGHVLACGPQDRVFAIAGDAVRAVHGVARASVAAAAA